MGPESEKQDLRTQVAVAREELRNAREAQPEDVGEANGGADPVVAGLRTSLKKALDLHRRQINEMARVHQHFLPHSFEPTGGLEFAAHCRPCHDMGGDFYHVEELANGRVIICMADVAGHGASAVVATAMARALLQIALLEHPAAGPAELMFRMAGWFKDLLRPDQFVTMWLGVWDPGEELLYHASAAHPSPVIWPAGDGPGFLDGESTIPLGLAAVDPVMPAESVVPLDLGDRIILYTDGWTESPSEQGTLLEGDAFLDFLANAEGAPTAMVPSILFMEFERHAANSRISDDVSLLLFDRFA